MRIEHVALYVNNLEKTKDFFQKYFNAKSNELYHNVNTGFKSYFLTFDDGSRLEIMNAPELKENDDQKRIGYAHIAMAVESKDKVDSLTNELKENGFEVTSGPRTTGDGYYESVIKGPENITIEITE